MTQYPNVLCAQCVLDVIDVLQRIRFNVKSIVCLIED